MKVKLTGDKNWVWKDKLYKPGDVVEMTKEEYDSLKKEFPQGFESAEKESK